MADSASEFRKTDVFLAAPVRPDWPLRTERLMLRPWVEGDFEAFFEMQRDEDVARWQYNEPRDEAESRRVFDYKKLSYELGGNFPWIGCAVVAENEVVEDLTLNVRSEEHRGGELGFIVHPRHQGNGYAAEAARALLRWAFEEVGFHRIYGRYEPRNVASSRVMEKLGMRKEAHFVENEWVKDEWQSDIVYAILDREWASRPPDERAAHS
jgi:RimJ/RimL family protein N-acetyltransferase